MVWFLIAWALIMSAIALYYEGKATDQADKMKRMSQTIWRLVKEREDKGTPATKIYKSGR